MNNFNSKKQVQNNYQRILFCKIAWMKNYCGITPDDKPTANMRYIRENGIGGEINNFNPHNDGMLYGYVEPMTIRNTGNRRAIHIEKIDPNFAGKDSIDDVLVIFCASRPNTTCCIVGWYKHATVYRNLQGNNEYNITAKYANAKLVPINNRIVTIPKHTKNFKYGFGQSTVWYANEPEAQEFTQKILNYVEDNSCENYYKDETLPEGAKKQVTVNVYERNPQARKKCIEHWGTTCQICGFDAAKVYGKEYAGMIEVHHIVPINQIGEEYNLDPIKDLIPVCPNCHTILHKKVDGQEITVKNLEKKFQKN